MSTNRKIIFPNWLKLNINSKKVVKKSDYVIKFLIMAYINFNQINFIVWSNLDNLSFDAVSKVFWIYLSI